MLGNNWKGFPFLFALCTAASLVIWFAVDVEKGRRDAVAFAASHRSFNGAYITEAKQDDSNLSSSEDVKASKAL